MIDYDRTKILKYKGIEFQCLNYSITGGRQLIVHTRIQNSAIPQLTASERYDDKIEKSESIASTFETQDVGVEPRRIKVNAIFSGESYKDIRTRVVNALREKPIGQLQTPDDGIIEVRVERFIKTYESTTHQYETIQIDFVEAAETEQTDSLLNETVEDATNDVSVSLDDTTILKSDYMAADSLSLKDKAKSYIDDNTGLLRSALSYGRQAGEFVGNTYEEALELLDEMLELSDEFVNDMSLLLGNVNDFTVFISTAFDNRILAYETLYEMSKSVGNKVVGLISDKDTNNSNTVNSIYRISAMNTAISQLDYLDFGSVTEVETLKDNIFDELDSIAAEIQDLEGYGSLYQSIIECRAQVFRVLSSKLAALPNLKVIHVKEAVPVEVLAYRLYQNIDRSQEIIDRNNIENPLFVNGYITILEN